MTRDDERRGVEDQSSTALTDRSAPSRHDHLGAGAHVWRELVPATHGAELRSRDRVRTVQLVDRRVDAPWHPFRLAGRALRYLPRRNIPPAALHSRASECVWQVHRVVPPIPFGLDRCIHLGCHDQQALGELGHCVLLAEWSCAHHDTTPTPSRRRDRLQGATTLADQPVDPVSTIERISPTVLPARPSCARFRPSERKSRRSIVEVSVMRPSMTGVATPAARPSSDMATRPHGTSSITYLCWSDGGVGVH